MRLDHLLAADPLGAALDGPRIEKATAVLSSFGFTRAGDLHVLDDTFPWVTVEAQDGLWRVHVELPLPAHLIETTRAVTEGLLHEAVLVRLDPLSRREISAIEWSRRWTDATGSSKDR
jgi:hypothetical protein